ncbi:PGL/p-HBAD biosynthesis glycosyltransferase [soil metagenome]
MTDQKIFSIIMATFNCGDKVEKTLRSILSQNEKLFELIVVDGASSDDTVDLISKYKENLTLVSERDNGIYDAFNKGIDLSTGKYLYFIGAGDCLRPGILDQVKDLLPAGPPTLVYGKCFFVKKKYFDGRQFKTSDFTWTNICHQGEFYHRSIFEMVGKYDEGYKVFADWMLNLKCFLNEEVNELYIPLYIADYEEGGISSEIDNDPAFKKEFPQFVKRKLGIRAFIKCKFKMMKPNSAYFTGGVGYPLFCEILGQIVPFFRPCCRYVRNRFRK